MKDKVADHRVGVLLQSCKTVDSNFDLILLHKFFHSNDQVDKNKTATHEVT